MNQDAAQVKALRHWRSVAKISLEQACLLVTGVDPHVERKAPSTEAARAKTLEVAIRQALDSAFNHAHREVHRSDSQLDPNEPDIWAVDASADRFLPTLELRQSVAAVAKDPGTVPLLVPVDPWYSETICGDELMRWLVANEWSTGFAFGDHQQIVVRERGETSWSDRRSTATGRRRSTEAESNGPGPWPWGDYETANLRALAGAVDRFWVRYDPSDPTTAPTNAQVVAWLKAQGVAERTAEIMATILRVDGLPTGPRK